MFGRTKDALCLVTEDVQLIVGQTKKLFLCLAMEEASIDGQSTEAMHLNNNTHINEHRSIGIVY